MKKTSKTLAFLMAVSAAVFLSTGCTAKVKQAYHERKAEKYFKAGNMDSAEIEYLNVIRSDQENRLAATRLGQIYFDQGRLQRASYFLSKASALDTNNADLKLKLGFVCLTFGRFAEARTVAEQVLASQPQDDMAPLLLEQTITRPEDVAVVRQKLTALIKGGDRAVPEVALGNLALREHDFATAGACYHRAQALDAKSPAVNMGLGSFSWSQGDVKQAEVYFKAAADASPVESPYRMQYARFKMKIGHLDEAQQILAEITAKAPSYVPAMMAAAEIFAGQKKYEQCDALLTKVLERDDYNFEAMLYQGQARQLRGDLSGALQSMNRMVRVFPQSPLAYYYFAAVNIAASDTDGALANLSRALDLQPNFIEAKLLQCQLLLRNGNAAPVIASLEKICPKIPDNLSANLLLADAYRIEHRVDDAMVIYRDMETRFTTNVSLPLLLGAAYLQKQNATAARAEFNRALALDPDNLTALGELVDADVAQKNFTEAMQRVQTELARRPQELELHLLEARVLITQGDMPHAEEKLKQTAALYPQNPSASLLLAQIYFDSKQNDKALARLDSALANSPKNISAWMMTAAIYSTEKEYAKAADAYEKVVTLDTNYSLALNNLACLYSENLNQPERAYVLAQQVHKLLPYEPSTADTLGWITFKRGDYADAYSLLKESVAKPVGADSPEIQYHFGLASYMMAEEAAAKTALQNALDKSKENEFVWREECRQTLALLAIDPANANASVRELLEKRMAANAMDPVALSRLGEIYARAGETDKALDAYQKLLALLPGRLQTKISLARLLATKDAPKAFEMAKAAYKTSPYDPEVQHLLGQTAYAAKDFKLSASALNETIKQSPANPQILFELARADFAIGKTSDAETFLKQALSMNAPAPLADEIQKMLSCAQTLNGSTSAADPNTIAAILKATPDYLPAQAVQAAQAIQSGDRAAAVAANEKIIASYPDFAPAQRALAILYARDPAKLESAYDLALQARENYPNDLPLIKASATIMFGKKDYQRTISLLKPYVEQLGNDPEVFYYLGAAQFQIKDLAASKRNLEKALTLKLSGNATETAKQMLAGMK